MAATQARLLLADVEDLVRDIHDIRPLGRLPMNQRLLSHCLLLAPLIVSACSADMPGSGEFVGSWHQIAAPIQTSRAALFLGNDGEFSTTEYPVSLACSAESDAGFLAGSGTWRLNVDARRIELHFMELSDARCPVPFLSNVFFEKSFGKLAIVAYPNGVDDVSTAIRFERSR
jgi:hypothetical protein